MPLCPKCGTNVPEFEQISQSEHAGILEVLDREGPLAAIQALRERTACDITTAKSWVEHRGGVHDRFFGTSPCPYCGEPLRSSDAKQCRACGRDWHDPENINSLRR
jgi:hypothetical protein